MAEATLVSLVTMTKPRSLKSFRAATEPGRSLASGPDSKKRFETTAGSGGPVGEMGRLASSERKRPVGKAALDVTAPRGC